MGVEFCLFRPKSHARAVRLACLLVVSLFHVAFATPAQAQTAQISGIVYDSSRAVVASASLTVENEATGTRREIVSDLAGSYTFPLLSPGTYRLTIEAPAFARLVKRGITLTVGQQARLDVILSVAAIEDTSTVEGRSSLLNSADASVGTTLDRRFVESIPMNGRSFQSLITLTPGIVATPGIGGAGSFSANGQRTMSNYFTIDGVSANLGVSASGFGVGQAGSGATPGLAATGGTNTLLSVEAFREVRILTSTFAPEYGRTPGAQISIVTRSGANNFEGSIYEYFRTGKLDANDWFVNNRGLTKPSTSYNNFGGTAGGPVLHNRSFFFVSYEGQRLNQPVSVISQVPSRAVRESTPSALRQYLDAFPLPTGPEVGNGLAELSASFVRPSDLDATSVRLDTRLSSRHTAFVRFNNGRSTNESRGGQGAGGALSYVQTDRTRTNTTTFGVTSVLSSSMVNDLRANYSTHRVTVASALDDFGGAVPFSVDRLAFGGDAARDFDMTFTLFSGLAGGYTVLGKSGGDMQQQINLVDTYSYVRGRHSLKAGFDYRRLTPQPAPPTQRYTYDFGGVANLVAGQPTRATVDWITPGRPLFQNFSAFVQDTYRVHSRITLTYGLRYDVNPPPKSLNDVSPLLVTGLDDPANLSFLSYGSPLWETSWTNLAPRIGVAYRLLDGQAHETVLRAGWGVFYDLGSGSAGDAFGNGHPYRNRRQYQRPTFPLSSSQLEPLPPDPTLPGGNTVYSFPTNLAVPRTQHWNVSIEHALGATQSLNVSYVGAAGRDLIDLQAYNVGRVNPLVQVVNALSNAGTSDYHALQLNYQRRLSHGIQSLTSYTWGHAIDTDSAEQPTPLPPSERVSPLVNRGSADFDIRHTFSSTLSYRPAFRLGNRVSRALLSDWQIDLVGMFRTGRPITPAAFQDVGFGAYYFRPDIVPGVPFYVDDPTSPTGERVNRDAFKILTEPRHGNLGRNTLRASPMTQIDMALSRTLTLGRGLRAQIRVEAFNLFNTPQFGPPVTLLNSPLFGTTRNTLANSFGPGTLATGGQNPLHAVGGPRSMQFTSRLYF